VAATCRHRIVPRAALLAAAALLLAGCGLSEYEAKLGSEKARVDRWDEETKALGEPLKMPELPKKDGKEPPEWKVFLRPPRGVSDSPVTAPNSSQVQLVGDRLAQYGAGGNTGFQSVYLGVANDVKEFKDFANSVYAALKLNVSAGSETPVAVERSPALLAAVGTGRALPAEIKFRRKTIDTPADAPQPSSFSFNFYESGKSQVVVVFQTEKGGTSRTETGIKLSLGTFGFDDEVRVLRDAYAKTNRKGPKK
jgi:hypothetical protein